MQNAEPNIPVTYEYLKIRDQHKQGMIHFHRRYELYYQVNGTTKYYVGDEIFYLKPGDFIVIPPHINHMTENESSLYRERILIFFEPEILDSQLLGLMEELCRQTLLHIPSDQIPLLEELLYRMESESQKKDSYQTILLRIYTLELLTLLCRYKTESVPETDDERFIHSVTEYIRANLSSDLSLPLLSSHFYLSECTLSRKFKKYSGMSISEYINSTRIHYATQLLEQGSWSITQLAHACGYNDSNYFSSVFKKLKGITPLKYGKRFRISSRSTHPQ